MTSSTDVDVLVEAIAQRWRVRAVDCDEQAGCTSEHVDGFKVASQGARAVTLRECANELLEAFA